MNYALCLLMGTALLAMEPVVIISGAHYGLDAFYKEYGQKEWENSDSNQREELINDFINRRVASMAASEIGLQYKPEITRQLYNRNNIALVNQTYEDLVARPLISNDVLTKTNVLCPALLLPCPTPALPCPCPGVSRRESPTVSTVSMRRSRSHGGAPRS